MEGWLKLHRKMLNWKWFSEPNTLAVFIYFLLKANTEDRLCNDIVVRTGELLVSRKEISNTTGLTEQMVRTAIAHLVSTNEISIRAAKKSDNKSTKKTTKNGTIITITNYVTYQNNFKGSQPRNKQQKQPINQPTRVVLDNILNSGVEEEKKKENISSHSSDIKDFPSLFPEGEIPLREPTEMEVNFVKFQQYIADNCPALLKMDEQITLDKFEKLKKEFDGNDIADAIRNLGNWRGIEKKYSSVYLTLLNYLKRNNGQRTTTMG